jgi:hypothetical protein
MITEIKKTEWLKFYRRFNATNLYRPARLSIVDTDGRETTVCPAPFMGIALTRQGRKISGIQFLAGQANPEHLVEPVVTVAEPTGLTVETDADGTDMCLRIRSQADRREIVLELTGQQESSQNLVQRVAYSLYERRGYTPGCDRDDWYEAEQKVRQVEAQLTR